jgi:hypothetical protein
MNKYTFIFLLIVLISFSSCENATERKLLEVRKSTKIDETKLRKGFDSNVKSELKDGIEYGVIILENSEKVKFWFQTHHVSEDGIGGTLFELPNGKLEFIEGYFCCEVQLPKNGKFKNSEEFIAEMEKIDGIHP